MKGEYSFQVKGKRAKFSFRIRRNITVLKGDSASGKTTLLSMMYEYLRSGRESGYSVTTDAQYYVYLRDEPGRDWTDVLYPLEDTIIFIEENNDFIFGSEFAEFVKQSGNYFVIVNRAPIKMLPYSIHEIYEIVMEGQHADVKECWHAFRELYSNFPMPENNRQQIVVTEDSNAGFEFFESVFCNSEVVSAGGNSNIVKMIEKIDTGDLLAIADGSAFGAMMENCMESLENKKNQRISLWLPESFEYLVLKSGVVSSKKLEDVLESVPDYLDCREYVSWERFFTDLLEKLTRETSQHYTKHHLPKLWKLSPDKEKIIKEFPEEIRENM